MSGAPVYRRKELFSTAVDDDLILFDEAGGQYFTTSGVGASIWEHLEEPLSFESLCRRMIAEYDVDRETCERDVRAFLDQLVARGVVETA